MRTLSWQLIRHPSSHRAPPTSRGGHCSTPGAPFPSTVQAFSSTALTSEAHSSSTSTSTSNKRGRSPVCCCSREACSHGRPAPGQLRALCIHQALQHTLRDPPVSLQRLTFSACIRLHLKCIVVHDDYPHLRLVWKSSLLLLLRFCFFIMLVCPPLDESREQCGLCLLYWNQLSLSLLVPLYYSRLSFIVSPVSLAFVCSVSYSQRIIPSIVWSAFCRNRMFGWDGAGYVTRRCECVCQYVFSFKFSRV